MAGLPQKSNSDSDSDNTESVNFDLYWDEEKQLTKVFYSVTDLALWAFGMLMKLFVAIANSISRPSLGIASTQGISSLTSDGVSGSRTERTVQLPKNEFAPNTRPSSSDLQAKKWGSSSNIDIPSSSRLQLIYDRLLTIEDPFHEAYLGERSETLREVSHLMSDVCLSELDCEELLRNVSSIIGQPIVKTLKFHLTIFVFPKGSKLPLHDHPEMTVLSSIVSGRMKVRAFDMLSEKPNSTGWRRARLIKNEVVDESSPTMILTPTLGNFHELEAETPCVMLDVLMPPYCDESRLCTYYEPTTDLNEVRIGEETMLKQSSMFTT